MADRWCDHGLYGAYAATPTWGAAQDGDGTAIGAATPATASIVFTGIPSSGTISVLGVTVSPTWATSADNCANLLATAINAATGTAVSPAGITRKSQVRNHVFARGPAGGAPAGTCQIMMRQGTAAVNSQVAITHTLNNVSSGGTINFSGGAGGAWGWIVNSELTIWASAITRAVYGLWAAQLPFCGDLEPGDRVKVRANKTLVFPNGISTTVNMPDMGAAEAPVVFEIDDGTVWPVDGSTPVLELRAAFSAAGWALTFQSGIGCFAHIKGSVYPGDVRSLVFSLDASTLGSPYIAFGFGPVLVENAEILAKGSPTGSAGPISTSFFKFLRAQAIETSNRWATYKNVRATWPGQTRPLFDIVGNFGTKILFLGGEIVATAPQSETTYIAVINNSSSVSRLNFDSTKFTGFVSGSRIVALASFILGEQCITLKNCDTGGLNVYGPNFLGAATGEFEAGTRGIIVSSQYGYREFVLERSGRSFAEWNYSKARPTLNARLHDNVTPWCIYAVPTSLQANIGVNTPIELPRISKMLPAAVDLAEAVRTFTVNFLMESNLAWTKRDVSVLVTYQDTTDTLRVIDSWDIDAGALTVSTAGWTATSWNGQTWLKREFSITTPQAVKAGTEVVVQFRLHSPSADETRGIILDPEILVA